MGASNKIPTFFYVFYCSFIFSLSWLGSRKYRLLYNLKVAHDTDSVYQTMKRCLIFFLGLVFAGQSWAENFEDGGLRYTVTDAENHYVSVEKGSTEPTGDLVIPPTVTYAETEYAVTSIGNDAFVYCSGLTSVSIPNSVTSIGNYAFQSCSGLTLVSIGNSVTSIGNYAFGFCHGLTLVSIPNSVTSIGNSAFYSCSGLTSVSIGNSVTSIGDCAFGYCSGLTSVSIPKSVTSIGRDAFYRVKNIVYLGNATGSPWGALTVNGTIVGDFIYTDANKTQLTAYIGNGGSVTIPGSVTSIGNYAFYSCSGLTSVSIGNSVTSIGNYAFYDCDSLTSVSIPNSVTSIGDNAFYNCDSLTSVSIPNSVTSIGNYAFGYCRGLTSVSIPKSVTSIGYYAFYNCSGLTSVTIPNSVTSIGNYAFGYCSGLTSVSIPNSVTSIGGYAFNNCSNLTINCVAESKPAGWDTNWNYSNCSVNWSVGGWEFDEGTGTLTVQIDINKESEENYPWHSFRNSITKVVFEDGVSSIGSYALSNCGNLTDVVVSASVETIGATAFSNCGKLKYNEYENALYLGNAGNPYIWLMKAKSSGISSCTINANCMHINRYAFENCNNLTSIDIPNSVTTIGEKAFYNCGGLREVSIPKPVTTIESQAFNNANISFYCEPTSRPSGWYCYYSSGYGTSSDWNSNRGTCYWGVSFDIDGLAYYITGQDSVDVVKYTNNDTAIVIPSTVTYSGTTYKVTGIKELAFENRNNLKTITIPNSVARIAALAFVEANKLETINVDAANANYTSVDGVLFNKDKTTLVCYPASNNKNVDYTIPSTVTTIESGAFYKCNTLNSIYIPYNVTNVGYYAISAKIIYCEPFFRPAGWNNYWRYSGDYYWSTRRTGDFIYTITEVDDDEFVAKLRAYTGDGGNVVIPTQITVREVAYEETDYSVIDVSTESKATYPVVSIESEVFRNCEGLTSVSIGESVTEINSSAFSNCTGLTSAYIGSSVKSISGYAFYNCSSLKTVTIPASVTFINTNAFNKCDSITTLVTNSNAIGSVFSNKSLLTTVSIGDSVTTIPDNAFKNCTALSSVSIPNSVTSIGESAFENCIELSSITIPKGVTSIGASAFKDCINLDIYCQAKVKYSGWDDNWNISECPVHMGANLFVVKATPNNAEWGTVTGSGNYMAGNEVRLMATASAGYRFVKWSDNNTDNPRVEIVDSDLTLSAVFEKVASATKFTVVGIANNAAFGSVTGTATYNYGDTATLAATANAGYRFVKWNDDNIANPRKVVVTDHLNLTAIFEVDNSTPASFMIVVVANNAAYGTTTGTAVYEAGTEAIISAVAAAGCYFAKWSDGNTDNPRKITVSSDLTITAIFAKDGEKPEDPGTAVEDEVAVAVNIYAYRNTIVVENADAEILVYNAMGRLVATSSDENAEIRVNGSGVYVVRVGNEAKRVMVNE